MLNWFARRMKEARDEEQGFTLIELLVVVIIIGILAAIAIPTFLGQRDRARDAAAVADLRNAVSGMEAYGTGTSPAYNFGGVTVAQLQRVEPSITWAIGGAAAVGTVNVTGNTNAAGNNRGLYVLTTASQSGDQFRANADIQGNVTYQQSTNGGAFTTFNP